jgi:hypothetical protein
VNGDTRPAEQPAPAGEVTGREQPANSAPTAATTTMALTTAEIARGITFRIGRHKPSAGTRTLLIVSYPPFERNKSPITLLAK